MPTVFLSYTRDDLDKASRLAEQLTAAGVTVWRDQEQLRAGQKWPKALGEAIAASDALVLLWSARAAQSDFVELEWSTALALKKRVLPCLLENVPVPPSLAAIEAVQLQDISETAQRISMSLANETDRPDASQTQRVIRQLGQIDDGPPSQVLQKAKAVFAQKGWTVHGPVYQAAGDIHIALPSPPQKMVSETRPARIAILAGAGTLALTALAVQLVRSNPPTARQKPPAQEAAVQQQSIAGSIWDEAGEPVPNVRVSVLMGDKLVASANTDHLGRYSCQVTAPLDTEVTLLAQEDRFRTEKRYTHLGNQGFNFKMRRKQE